MVQTCPETILFGQVNRRIEVSVKGASRKAKSDRVFGQSRKRVEMFWAGLYARVSTNDQQTIPLQMRALREYAARRGWTTVMEVKEIDSSAAEPARRCVAFWQRSDEKASQRPDSGRANPQRSHRGCLRAGRAGDGLVLLSKKKIRFPFQAKCIAPKVVSRLRKGEIVEVRRLAPEDACASDMLVLIRWQGRNMAVPLSQLAAIDPDESTEEAIGDWHYWVSQGPLF
jgi:Calcium binding/Resolvase, N terminal domain